MNTNRIKITGFALVASAALIGCGQTKTVTQQAPPTTTVTAPAATASTTTTPPVRTEPKAQHFSGVSGKNLGTIVVPVDSTLRWHRTGETMNGSYGIFGIEAMDENGHRLSVRAADTQTKGETSVDAGTYRNVIVYTVNTWSIDIVPNE